ncbi:hypothetical protein JCM19239_1685 [Vibrio variabilis]|uniref:Uncharacterized protein n=1 Tax=Vibrio variabilis TaxID=990271 RepID=A0ABQ0JJP2_9VIBR|nr:hypothetical protein JCM19239_1685 [Vibrio variabilis]
MLQLDTNTITLNQSSDNKLNAIKAIAADLTSKGWYKMATLMAC